MHATVTKKKKINWAIIGLGKQGHRIAQAINCARNGKLIAAVGSERKSVKKFAETYGAIHYSTDLRKIISLKEIDAIFISSPTYKHKKHSLLSLKAKKHVLCEKPMALSSRDGLTMVKEAKKNGKKIYLGFHLRHHPLHQYAKQLISQGKLGILHLIEAHWSVGKLHEVKLSPFSSNELHMAWRENRQKSGGGALTARGVHLFDLIQFLTDKKIKEVSGYADTLRKKTAVDSLAAGILRLENDCPAIFATGRIIPQAVNRIIIYGSAGRIILANTLSTNAEGILEFLSGKKILRKKGNGNNLYQKEVEDFGDTILGKKNEILADARDGLHGIAVTEAFIRSTKYKKTEPVIDSAQKI